MTTEVDARREQVLAALVTAGSAGLSGQALADELACSRAAVHRHVESLRRSGIGVDGVHEGYRLAADADPVVPLLVTPRLVSPLTGPVQWSPQTGSTNDDAVAAARAGAAEGLIVGADVQTAGRGRRGRPWSGTAGDGLLFSVVLRPQVSPADVALVPIVAATAVADAIGDNAGIVWPNDILIADRKVCGILCELAADEAGVTWVVVGIGVNVRAAPTLTDHRWTPGSLADGSTPPSRADLLVTILARFASAYADWRANGPHAALSAFAERDQLRGAGVTVQTGTTETMGTAQGVDDTGRLRVLTGAGEVALGAGEVTRVEWS